MTCRVKGYEIEFDLDEYGGWIVAVPELPCCISYGESIAHAKVNIEREIEDYLATIGDTEGKE